MNIGFNYLTYPDASSILYALRRGKINCDPSNLDPSRIFTIDYLSNTYTFSKKFNDIEHCDLKIALTHNDREFYHYAKNYDKIILTPIDNVTQDLTDQKIVEFLDAGNVLISSISFNVQHKRLIFEPLIILDFWYHNLGYKFLNFYPESQEKKLHLLGIYHRPIHISGNPHLRRNRIFETIKDRLGGDLHQYACENSEFDALVNSYKFFGHWYNANVTSYTDFQTSVCNLIFETYDSIGTYVDYNRVLLTEKTLKAILFSAQNIFFMWYGDEKLMQHIKQYGFWFLNFEFYNPDSGKDMDTAVLKSIYSTVDYLKQLKSDLKTNENVNKYLLERYGDKLSTNIRLFKQYLNDCQYTDRLVSLITE